MRRRKNSKARGERRQNRLSWGERGEAGFGGKEWNELRKHCRDKGQAKRTPTHRDRDTTLDPALYRLYSTGRTQNLSAAETHPKAAEAPQQDMGTGPNTQEDQAAAGNGGVSVTRMRIPRNRKLAARVITQSTPRSNRSLWAHVSGLTWRGGEAPRPRPLGRPGSPAPSYGPPGPSVVLGAGRLVHAAPGYHWGPSSTGKKKNTQHSCFRKVF